MKVFMAAGQINGCGDYYFFLFRTLIKDFTGRAVGVVVKALRYKPAGRAGSIPDGVTGMFQ